MCSSEGISDLSKSYHLIFEKKYLEFLLYIVFAPFSDMDFFFCPDRRVKSKKIGKTRMPFIQRHTIR